MAKAGRFITLEGGEGVGKSTLAATLKKRLEDRGLEVVLTREPGGTPRAEQLRDVILHQPQDAPWTALSETLLFYAARTEHLEGRIRPALARGAWVICDRFSDSTRAYQSAAGGVSAKDIDAIDAICVGETRPELTLVLDLSQKTARSRMAEEWREVDAIEARGWEYHEAVRQAFLDIAKADPQRCVVLDASRTAAEVATAAMIAIDQRFGTE
ncbi:MAG: dTMP kinase [Alphaproteobacteria bacterium]|nr:dTMP kinase [Alphaproteobacteria bacterium]